MARGLRLAPGFYCEFNGPSRRAWFGHGEEFGYWGLSGLAEIRGPMGMMIERDLHFHPTPLEQCQDPTRRQR